MTEQTEPNHACWGYYGYENAENELQFRMGGE